MEQKWKQNDNESIRSFLYFWDGAEACTQNSLETGKWFPERKLKQKHLSLDNTHLFLNWLQHIPTDIILYFHVPIPFTQYKTLEIPDLILFYALTHFYFLVEWDFLSLFENAIARINFDVYQSKTRECFGFKPSFLPRR